MPDLRSLSRTAMRGHPEVIGFSQYPVVQSEFETMNLANCRIYFSHRAHRGHRGGIFDYFLNLCVSVSSVRYNLFLSGNKPSESILVPGTT